MMSRAFFVCIACCKTTSHAFDHEHPLEMSVEMDEMFVRIVNGGSFVLLVPEGHFSLGFLLSKVVYPYEYLHP